MGRHAIVVGMMALALGGCASMSTCGPGSQPAVHDTLYLGTGKPGGGVVTDAEWAQFLAEGVTPRFPQGLTVGAVSGQWRGADGAIVREATHVLQLVHAGDAPSEAHVVAIAQAYKARFGQEAVLRVSDRVCASF